MNNSEIALQAFKHLQLAYQQKLIDFKPCKTSNDLSVHIDFPTGMPRFTYVIFDSEDPKKIIAQCIVNFSRMVSEHDRKWDIGWCVDEAYRNQGYGFKVASNGLDEFLTTKNIRGDCIEASVDEGNLASLNIAEKLIGSEKKLLNSNTGLTVHSFLKVID